MVVVVVLVVVVVVVVVAATLWIWLPRAGRSPLASRFGLGLGFYMCIRKYLPTYTLY